MSEQHVTVQDALLPLETLADLDTPERLRAIAEDPRAGFLPTTHSEKNEALSLLDFIDSSEHPGGVHDKLAEIYAKHKKDARERGTKNGAVLGSLAVQSIVYTYGDYFMHAKKDLRRIRAVRAAVMDTPGPNVRFSDVAEEHGMDASFTALVIRYVDLSSLRSVNKDRTLPFDPLHTLQHRFAQPEYGKNKTIYDVYTAPEISEQMQEYIEKREEELTVRALRGIVSAAEQDQHHRAFFWWNVLQSRPYEYHQQFELARRMIQSTGE